MKKAATAFFCPELVVKCDQQFGELVMDAMDYVVLDPRDVADLEWDSVEPELDQDDIPVFDRGRSDVVSVEELFDNPEEF